MSSTNEAVITVKKNIVKFFMDFDKNMPQTEGKNVFRSYIVNNVEYLKLKLTMIINNIYL
jgi:hypothetical protein